MIPSESDEHGSNHAEGTASEREYKHPSPGSMRLRRPLSTRERDPKVIDVRVADAAGTPWPLGCAGLVMTVIPPPTDPDPDLSGKRKARIGAIVDEAGRLLENNGLLAAFLAPSTVPPWTVPGEELLEHFGRNGLERWGEILWLRPKASAPLVEESSAWRSPYNLPLRLPPVRIILATLSASFGNSAFKVDARRDLADRYFLGSQEWYRDLNAAWWPMRDTLSDEVLTGEAAARVIARHGIGRETVVCLSGELDAAIATIQMGWRCRLTVRNEHEQASATWRLSDELRRRRQATKP